MSDRLTITLTTAETYHAAMIGITRQVTNLRDCRTDAYGAEKDVGWQLHCEGACGEQAFAKFFGLYWSGAIGDLKADDVGYFQVRTNSRNNGDLILHYNDPDDRIFVLLTGLAPTYTVRGWLWGAEGKDDRWWRESAPGKGRAAFFVPQSALKPMSAIALLKNQRRPSLPNFGG